MRSANSSRSCESLDNMRKYGDPFELTPSERALLDALVKHGGVAKVARALGLGEKSTSSRMSAIREKLGVATSKQAIEIAKRAAP